MSSTDSNETKRPVGRPCAYKPEYCQIVIECAKQGMSKAESAVECDVTTFETLTEWAQKYQEFSDALKKAEVLRLAWWEKQGRLGVYDMEGQRLNASYTKQMAARFPKEWREQSTTEIVGSSDASPVVIGFTDLKKAKNG